MMVFKSGVRNVICACPPTALNVLQARKVVAPWKRGVIGSMAAASDGPRQPIPDTMWVAATTGEDACTIQQALTERQPASNPSGVLLLPLASAELYMPAGQHRQYQPHSRDNFRIYTWDLL
jgi:hypothetical protein